MTTNQSAGGAVPTDKEIVDAYIYLYGRYLVLQQEAHDINVDKAGYNKVKYNPLGSAAFVNPNLNDKRLLSGVRSYEIRFPADALPSSHVDGFWSVTLYSVPDYRVVENPMKRYGLNNVSPLEKNPDGSLSLWLASSIPEGIPASNWLPTPAGKGFSMNLRMYVPKQDVRDGKWFPPAIEKV
jgi:hypothetical protein